MYNNFSLSQTSFLKRWILNNFSQGKEEGEVKDGLNPFLAGLEGEDIEFDENIDIDEIQKKLNAHMNGLTDDFESPAPSSETFEDPTTLAPQESAPVLQNVPQEIAPGAKKYVVYIEPESIEFMERLSINDRKTIINKILKEQEESIAQQKYSDRRQKFLRHIIVATLTFIIGFPLLFFVVNNAMEATIYNYKQAQKNFGVLYREGGKIKQKEINP